MMDEKSKLEGVRMSARLAENHIKRHILTARQYVRVLDSKAFSKHTGTFTREYAWRLVQGAFCESCLQHRDRLYWHCRLCFGGAWGFCDVCVGQGKHCTHALYPMTHESSLSARKVQEIPKDAIASVPHLAADYFVISVRHKCADCRRKLEPEEKRHHCYFCAGGDYDLCEECFDTMYRKISMPKGWKLERRCLKGHRMAILDYMILRYGNAKAGVHESHIRFTIARPIGGQRKLIGEKLYRCAAIYSWFPRKTEGYGDVLEFPRGAEILEVSRAENGWLVGAYCGRVGRFPEHYVHWRGVEDVVTEGRVTEI